MYGVGCVAGAGLDEEELIAMVVQRLETVGEAAEIAVYLRLLEHLRERAPTSSYFCSDVSSAMRKPRFLPVLTT